MGGDYKIPTEKVHSNINNNIVANIILNLSTLW